VRCSSPSAVYFICYHADEIVGSSVVALV
jgi:hypothetical protein